MKKIICAIAALGLIFLCSSCMSMMASLGGTTKDKASYRTAAGTPADSVVFYGVFAGNTNTSFSQMNYLQISIFC